jgi:hypothetical protein
LTYTKAESAGLDPPPPPPSRERVIYIDRECVGKSRACAMEYVHNLLSPPPRVYVAVSEIV